MEKKQNSRNAAVYVAALLCAIAAVLDTVIGMIENWPTYVYAVVWIQMVIIIVTALVKKVPLRLQAFLFSTFTFITVFLTGLYLENYLVEFMMFSGTLLMASFYHDRIQIVYQSILILIGLYLHAFVFRVIDLGDRNNRIEFTMEMFLLCGTAVVLYINIIRDDIARAELADTARRAEKAERSKSDFLANMSHEIRTPMNAIIGMCELALRENHISKNVRECCLQIQTSGRSLLSIINDILDFSKIESGKMELQMEEFNLTSIVNDVVNMTMSRMGDKNLEFIVQVDPSIPRGLIGDEIRIRQIMINLLTNAVKYTREGVISLTVSKNVRKYGINLNVSVKDSGIGIKQENLEKLFSSFQQVDTKKNRAVEGTGLGLVITKRLVTAMGGFINVESEYGRGSEFKFVIPMKVADPYPLVTIQNSDEINVAIFVDVRKFDNPQLRNSYKQFLAEIGESIQIKNVMCRRADDVKLRIERGNLTHCFIGKEEYLENKEYFDRVADKIEIVLVQNRRDAVTIPANMKCLYKPIYELPIANLLNGDALDENETSEQRENSSFVAPGARILLVDDNDVNLKVATGLMQPYRMQITTASSGREAIKLLESKSYDLVFMDHMMPELDGVETTKLIRGKEDSYFKTIPIVALTANAVGGAREMFAANGFNGFLPKPIELSALERILKQLLPYELLERTSGNTADKAKKQMAAHTKEEAVQAKEKPEVPTNQSAEPEQEEDLQQIDIPTGLGYVANSMEIYLSILETYAEQGPEKAAYIRRLFGEKEWKNYIIEVHALKSSSLSIGAKDLSEKAKALELSGKAGDYAYIENNHEEALALYDTVLAQARQILAKNGIVIAEAKVEVPEEVTDERAADTAEEAAGSPVTGEVLLDLINRFREAVDAFDSDELESLAKEGKSFLFNGRSLTAYFEKIETAVADFEYDAVTTILEEMAKSIGLEEM